MGGFDGRGGERTDALDPAKSAGPGAAAENRARSTSRRRKTRSSVGGGGGGHEDHEAMTEWGNSSSEQQRPTSRCGKKDRRPKSRARRGDGSNATDAGQVEGEAAGQSSLPHSRLWERSIDGDEDAGDRGKRVLEGRGSGSPGLGMDLYDFGS